MQRVASRREMCIFTGLYQGITDARVLTKSIHQLSEGVCVGEIEVVEHVLAPARHRAGDLQELLLQFLMSLTRKKSLHPLLIAPVMLEFTCTFCSLLVIRNGSRHSHLRAPRTRDSCKGAEKN